MADITHQQYWDMTRERQREVFAGVGSMAETFIQWKGTGVCMDFHCKCGAHHHLDEEFVYGVHCTNCGRTYVMGDRVPVFDVTGTEYEDFVLKSSTTHRVVDEMRD